MDPSTDWAETVGADEEDRLPRLAEKLAGAQKLRDGATPRALHAKMHAGLRASFTVLGDLPPGIVMRARKHAYYASTKARDAAKEPDGSQWDAGG
ncbi:MAG TPA: hypothetical protein VGG39_20395 [Polyangiaceae bacterium]|jgi:hypothetical protein